MLSQYEILTKKKVDEKKGREEESIVSMLPENPDNDSSELDDVWCPYIDPAYKGPHSTLDAFPQIVESIKTQTLEPDLIIERFREGLDTNTLNLYARKFNVNNIRMILLPFLKQNPQITALKISGNDIEDEGAKLIATNRTIKKLDVSTNEITDVGVIALCQNKNITCLNIAFNNLTEKGIEALANNSALVELHISFNQFHKDIDIRALDFFFKNDTLNIFRCSGVSAETLDSFWKELIQQRKLRDQDRNTLNVITP